GGLPVAIPLHGAGRRRPRYTVRTAGSGGSAGAPAPAWAWRRKHSAWRPTIPPHLPPSLPLPWSRALPRYRPVAAPTRVHTTGRTPAVYPDWPVRPWPG